MSWATDLSPTALFTGGSMTVPAEHAAGRAGVGVPGVGGWVGPGGVLYRVPIYPPRDPYLVYSWPQGPTYGQMKVNLRHIMRFPEVS